MTNHLTQFHKKTNIHNLLVGLKKKVQGFAVIDRQGQLIGKVKDLILDTNRRLNLVVFQQGNKLQDREGKQSLVRDHLALLWSRRIKKIDNNHKYIFLDIDKSEINYMPEYLDAKTPNQQNLSDPSNEVNVNSPASKSPVELAKLEEIEEQKNIRLLEERLVVDSTKRKVGEVIVRKEIETQMVQVPVRREKLIVEQISPEHRQLAEIDLGQEEISGIELIDGESQEVTSFAQGLSVTGSFSSPKIASLLLNAIALERNHGCKQVRVSILVEDEEQQQKYQEWFNRCSQGQIPKPKN